MFVTALFVVPLLVVSSTAVGQQVYIYPNHGQGVQQQSRDRYECHTWAVQQTGVDPTAPSMARSTPPGGLLRGAAGGAALGVVGGAIAGPALLAGRPYGTLKLKKVKI